MSFHFQNNYYDSIEFSKKHVVKWNHQIDQLALNEKLLKSLEEYHITSSSISSLKFLIIQIVVTINDNHKLIQVDDVCKLVEKIINNYDKVSLITGLSVLEICLLIAIKHHCNIYDNDPFNFEMILTRFNKFAMNSSTMQNIDREMALKRFENLRYQEFIVPIGANGKVQKEYQMYKLMLLNGQIDKAVQKYQNLPTEIEQWTRTSIL